MSELEQLLETLRLEKQEDFEQFKTQVQSLPLSERIRKGYSKYPLVLMKQGFGIGERGFVVLGFQEQKEEDHQFRAGKPVVVFGNHDNGKRHEIQGVVHYINKNSAQIILNGKFLPDWLRESPLGIDLQFDERSYLEMEAALDRVIKAKSGRLEELREVLLGNQPAGFSTGADWADIPALNASQNEAVRQILNAKDVGIVHGPPGTGKTTTLVYAVKMLSRLENTVLVCAPSNTAADLLAERLSDQELQVIRLGNISRIDEKIIRLTLDVQASNHPESKNIKKIRVQAAEARKRAARFRRKLGYKERQERQEAKQEAAELSAWADQLEDKLIDELLDGAQVIVTTLVGANHKSLGKRRFHTVVIDEAAQALEPASWIPILRAGRVIFAGDPFQLPPTVKSIQAQRQGLSITLMEKCMKRIERQCLLKVQYRMHEDIMGFSNSWFYDGILQAHEQVQFHGLEPPGFQSMAFIDTAGFGFNEEMKEGSLSRFNPGEFFIIREHLSGLVEAHREWTMPGIVLISPYKEQTEWMATQIESDGQFVGLPIDVHTIDGFQGQERDVVYISLVRSNTKCEIGFLNDYRRMNVAMTRARKKLVIVGDSATICADPFYRALVDHFEKRGAYRSAGVYVLG